MSMLVILSLSLASVTSNFLIDKLVHEVERWNHLKLILLWLETHVQPRLMVLDAVVKIYINGNNNNPEQFLKENNVSNNIFDGLTHYSTIHMNL
jgi:hypothetical protein